MCADPGLAQRGKLVLRVQIARIFGREALSNASLCPFKHVSC